MERVSNSAGYEIVRTTKRDGWVYYKDESFEYIPKGWVKLNNQWYPLGYRVTTSENKSLGLDHNTDILTYELHNWVGVEKEDLVSDIKGRGGVWTTLDLSHARNLQRYCLARSNYSMRTRVYLAAVDNPIFATSYRVKSQRIMLLEELR